jgi:hypothetical protein
VDLKEILQRLDHNPYWLDRYFEFMAALPYPEKPFQNHHILPEGMYPEFVSFKRYPWNRLEMKAADHLIAHYYLYRALPGEAIARAAFICMTGMHRMKLIEQNYDENLIREVAEEYQKAQLANLSFQQNQLKGWVRIYKTEKLFSVCPPDQIEQYTAKGWKVGVPKYAWVTNGMEEHRVLASHIEDYLAKGFALGRFPITEEHKRAIGDAALKQHEIERQKSGAYSYLPRGDQHHRRILGCPDEVAKKISKTLTGRPQPPEHPVHKGIAKGKHWSWSPEAKARKSAAMMGEGNNRYGKEGYWKGKTRPEETREKMSTSHLEFFQDPEKAAALDATRPRGEEHAFYGKHREESTREKIAHTLTGRRQSQATKDKRSKSLKAFHAAKKGNED